MEPAPLFDDVADGPPGGRAFWLTAADGVRLRIAVWPAALREGGARGTVLLFPGRTEYAEKYGRTAALFAERGYATVAVDWRGQGIADRLADDLLAGHVTDFDAYQRDVDAVRAATEALDLPRPRHLLGHSMGGCIGLRALHRGLPVASAGFTGPMWGIGFPGAMRPLAWALAWGARMLGQGQSFSAGVTRGPYVLETAFEDNKLTTDAEMYDHMIRQTRTHPEIGIAGPTWSWLLAALRECRALARMPAPTQACATFVGRDEDIVDVAAIERRMADWPGGRLEVLSPGRHEVLMESPADRAKLADALVAHFEAQRVRQADEANPRQARATG